MWEPFWLASALGLNAAGNTGSNLASLPPLVIHSDDYFSDPDYLKQKDRKDIAVTNSSPMAQSMTIEVQDITNFHDNPQHVDYRLSLNHNPDTQPNNYIENSIDISHANSFSETQSVSNVKPVAQNPSPQPVVQPPLDKSDETQKKKKSKRKFKKWQVDALERQYAIRDYSTHADRKRLEEELKLSSCQIACWFQNKRYRMKRESKPLLVLKTAIQSSSQLQFNYQYVPFSSDVSSSPSTISHQSSVSPQPSIPSCDSIDFQTIGTGEEKPSMLGFEKCQLKALNELLEDSDL